jgi:putative Ca2+/H+ antiporter (TMEM165/GDT1 family)
VSDLSWLGVLGLAFGAQLAVLPGEKVQFIIAGLSTRYHPLLVVSAAGTAFAGWTVLEILLGGWLQEVLPPLVLDSLTALMFFLFAVLLYRSTPEAGTTPTQTDGGALDPGGDLRVRVPGLGWRVPNALGGFLPIFAMMAFGEFGDKTQLITITIAGNHGQHPTAIWLGEMLAIIPVSLANAYFFNRFSHRWNLRRAHLVGAALFAFFGADTLLSVVTGQLSGVERLSVWEWVVTRVADVVTGAA